MNARQSERTLLLIVAAFVLLGFVIVTFVQQSLDVEVAPFWTFATPIVIIGLLAAAHLLLTYQKVTDAPLLLPIIGLLMGIGLILLQRLFPEAARSQLLRGFVPGMIGLMLLIRFPQVVESLRRDWPMTVSLIGLVLLLATAFFGRIDETGTRLALQIGSLPAIQTTEAIKVALIVFLAWYIESEGEAAERHAFKFAGLSLPPLRYFLPSLTFVAIATLALVKMSDFGAILILTGIFLAMLYIGFNQRIFFTIMGIAVAAGLIVGIALFAVWDVPATIQQRVIAFRDPFSTEELVLNGQPQGYSIALGPGYQSVQGIQAIINGGFLGTGLGWGVPENVPLSYSDFIFAALVEELGAAGGFAVLLLFGLLIMRIVRLAMLLPAGQIFERLLLVGIAAHFLTQVLVMVGGTVLLLPVTGVTIPFVTLGGMALLVNLLEMGIVFALAQRISR